MYIVCVYYHTLNHLYFKDTQKPFSKLNRVIIIFRNFTRCICGIKFALLRKYVETITN